MSHNVEALREKLVELVNANDQVIQAATDRDLTEDEMVLIDQHSDEIASVQKQIEMRDRASRQKDALDKPEPRMATPDKPSGEPMQASGRIEAPRSQPGKHDFRDFTEFNAAVYRAAATQMQNVDPQAIGLPAADEHRAWRPQQRGYWRGRRLPCTTRLPYGD